MSKFKFSMAVLGSGLALAGAHKAWVSARPAGLRLRNSQGVGPAHFPGTNRGEDRVKKKGNDELSTVAGRQGGAAKPV